MKLHRKNKGYCLLEVDEMETMTQKRDLDEIINIINETGASRKSFNTWLFPTVESAEEFTFMYSLKYAN